MSRHESRPQRKPRKLGLEALETRQLMSTLPERALLARTPAARRDLMSERAVEPRPDLDPFAADLVHRPRMAYRMGLGALSRELSRPHHEPVAARHGWGACLVTELTRHPIYAARKRLTHLLIPPDSASRTPAGPEAQAVPAGDVPAATPEPDASSPDIPPEQGPEVTQVGYSVAVGSSLAVTVPSLGLGADGKGLTFTITPQPLPANMTFNRGTGELAFAPAPDQVGTFDFSVLVSDGHRSAKMHLPVTVASTATQSTEVSGQVVDEEGVPLAGVPVHIGGITTATDREGRFRLSGVPDRPGSLTVDGEHTAAADRMMLMAPLAAFLEHPAYERVDNAVAEPIVLPRVDLEHATDFGLLDPHQAHDLTSPALPGVVLHVAPDCVVTTDGRPYTGRIALTELPEMAGPSMGVEGPDLMVTGPDLMFLTPARITLPNRVGLPPGSVVGLMTMSMISGAWEVTGHLQVTEDGRSLETIDGGVTASSCLIPQFRAPGAGMMVDTSCEPNASSGGPMDSDAGLATGAFYLDHSTVTYASQGQDRGLVLRYSSLQVDPHPVLQFMPSTQAASNASLIDYITAQVTLGGVIQGAPITYEPSALGDGMTYRIPIQADASALATGLYAYEMAVTHYSYLIPDDNDGFRYSVSSTYKGTVGVVNTSATPLGAGWSIGGLQRITTTSPTGPVMIVDGARGSHRFDLQPAGPVNDLAFLGVSGASTSARVLSNDGRGHFALPTVAGTTAAGSPVAVAAGDFDGNGTADLAEIAGSGVSLYLSDGLGGFTAGASYTLASTLAAIVTGVFTGHGNGTLDLAVLVNDGTVAVLSGTGSGTFGPAIVTTVGGGTTTGPGSMSAGDFDGDADLDLAVATTGDGLLRVLGGDGAGGFGVASSYTLAGAAKAVVTGDLTGDGEFDLAVVSVSTPPTLSLLTGDGIGGFAVTGTFSGDSHGAPARIGLAIGDFSGTGQLAVAMASNTAGALAILPGSPSGSWGAEVLYPGAYSILGSVSALVAADVNGDGRHDLIVSNGSTSLKILASQPGTNQMEQIQSLSVGAGAVQVAAGAFTGRSLQARYVAMGDTSTLTRNIDLSWTRSYSDGSVAGFDSSGRQTSLVDRNTNTVTYTYVAAGPAAGALETMTDPVGLQTVLAYDVAGHLSTLTDPAGRIDLPPNSGPRVMRVRGRGSARRWPGGAERPPA